MILTEIFLVQGANQATELPPQVLLIELLYIHGCGVVFGIEPLTPLAFLLANRLRLVSYRFLPPCKA